MALVSLLDVHLGFGGPAVLDGVNFNIEAGDRIGLVGRNGAGKSTLMRVVANDIAIDAGQVAKAGDLRMFWLRQEVPEGLAGTVRSIVEGDEGSFEEHHDWERFERVESLIEAMGLPPETLFSELSAGMKRRVMLARGLAGDPNLLLLDEPTNHLDLASIEWLENFILGWSGALLFVTHDRAFLQKLAVRIAEVDRGRIISWSCNHATFLERKAALLEAEESRQALFDKKMALEEAWIRKGVKARRTRNMGRVAALLKMRRDRALRRNETGQAKIEISEAIRSGTKVVTADNAGFKRGDRWIIQGLSTIIERGDKIGIIGPNGAGKTTLLRLLLGELTACEGVIKPGTNLQIAYFDQLRAQLDENKTVQDAVAEGRDTVTVNGRQRHVMSYLQDFLFDPTRARTPIRALSGGERNRLLLARLFTKPANVLVLDEPTNDLDAETLELLESLIVEFEGTVLLVSHDRAFLDNVATGLLIFEGEGKVTEYTGGYQDWQLEVARKAALPAPAKKGPAAPAAPMHSALPPAKARKLSFKEQKELDELPAKVGALETEQSQLVESIADPKFYTQTSHAQQVTHNRLAELEKTIAELYKRWEALEG